MEKINISSPLRSMPYALSNKKITLMIFLLSFAGFLVSTYITIHGLNRTIPPCTVTHGCETVLTSQFATVGPIPIAAFGAGFFITMMILSILYLQHNQKTFLRLLFALASLAFIAGLGLIYIQAVILKAFCQFCLLAELIIALIFILTLILFFRKKN